VSFVRRDPVALAVVLLAVGLYANSVGGGFALDDQSAVLDDPKVHSIARLPEIFTSDYWEPTVRAGLYRPLVKLSFVIDYAIGGTNPLGYHLVNVALHAVVCVLVLVLARRVSGGDAAVAAATATLFAALAVHVEAVANVTGRAELLCAAWFLLSVLGYASFHRTDGPRAKRLFGLSVCAYALALLSKENAITLLGVLLLFDLCLGPGVGGRLRERLRSLPLRHYVPYLVVTGLYLTIRSLVIDEVQATDAFDNPLVELAAPLRIANAFVIAWRYFGLLLLPLNLSYDYSWGALPILSSVWEPTALLATAGVLAVFGLIAWSWRAHPPLCFGVGFGVVTFFIVSNIAIPIGTIMGERLLYLPSVGFCLAAALAARLGLAALLSNPRHVQAAFVALFAVAVALNGWLTVKRNPVWVSDERLMLSALETQPGSAKVRHNAGSTYLALREPERAEAELRRAVEIYPRYGRAYASLGHVLVARGRTAEAIENYERARELKFTDARTANNLGFLLIDEDIDLPRGVALVETAVRIEPDNLNYVDSLGWAYFKQGRAREAHPLLVRALEGAETEAEAKSRRRHLQEVQRALAAQPAR